MKFEIRIQSDYRLMSMQNEDIGIDGIDAIRKELEAPDLATNVVEGCYRIIGEDDYSSKHIELSIEEARRSSKFNTTNLIFVNICNEVLPKCCIKKVVFKSIDSSTGKIKRAGLRLTTNNKEIIRQWIAAGYPNKIILGGATH